MTTTPATATVTAAPPVRAARGERAAKIIFWVAACYGIPVILLMIVAPKLMVGEAPLAHPEHYYGFAAAALAWQIAFVVIATDPARYRPLIPAAACEKLFFALAVLVLFLTHRVPATMLGPAGIDVLFGVAFGIAFRAART